MRLHLYSDLHLDHYKDQGASFLKSIEKCSADVGVFAGDITTGKFPNSFRKLFEQIQGQYKHSIIVPGNHEFYGTTPAQVKRSYDVALQGIDNIHVLDNDRFELSKTVNIYGGTMWYADDPQNIFYEEMMNDVHYIKDFKPWVYEQQLKFENMLRKDLIEGDIIVTHHLPSYRSVDPLYKSSALNRFFVCEMEWIMYDRKPALWMHGHTHKPCDYKVENTRIVCNPRGYPRENYFPNGGEYKPLEIIL